MPSKPLEVGAFPLAGNLCKLINFSITDCKFADICWRFSTIQNIWYALQRKLQTSQYSCSVIRSIQKSAWSDVVKVVPQGSILGPCIKWWNQLTDDLVQVKFPGGKPQYISINPYKLKCPKNDDLQIEVNDNVITATSTMKILGIHSYSSYSKLNFNGRIAFLCTKAGGQFNVLQRMMGSLDYVSRMAIYNSFIISNFNYCPVVWMFTIKSSLNKLKTFISVR